MALEKQNISIPFAEGVDTKTDPKQVQPPKLLLLENAVFQKTGSLIKRNAFNKFGANSTYPIQGLSTFKDQLIAVASPEVISYSDTTDTWNVVGSYAPANVSKQNGLNQDIYYPSNCYDTATDTLFMAWQEYDYSISPTARIKFGARDLSSGSPRVAETDVGSGASTSSYVRSFATADHFYVIWQDNVNSLVYIAVPKNNLTTYTGPFTISTSAAYTGQGFSGFVSASNGNLYLIYPNGVDSKIAYITPPSTLSSTTTVSGVDCRYGSAIQESPGTYLIFFANSAKQVKSFSYNYTLTVPSSTVTYMSLVATITIVSRTAGVVSITTSANHGFYVGQTVTVAASPTTGVNGTFVLTFVSGVFLQYAQAGADIGATANTGTVTAADIYSGVVAYRDVYAANFRVFTTRLDTTIKTSCVMSGFGTNASASFQNELLKAAGLIGNVLYNPAYPAQTPCLPVAIKQGEDDNTLPWTTYSGIYTNYLLSFALGLVDAKNPVLKFYDQNAKAFYTTSGHPDYSTWVQGSDLAYYGLVKEYSNIASLSKVSFTHSPSFAELGNTLHCSGGILYAYDGVEWAEHNFLQVPISPIVTRTGAGLIPDNTTYYYATVYEWQDAAGQTHESAPSQATTFLLASGVGASTLSIKLPTLKLTFRKSQIYIAVYRSNDGLNFYRCKNTGIGSNIQNNTATDFITYSDNIASLLDQKLLYTSGGEVPNIASPACNYISAYKKRLISIPSEDSNTWWYSKDIVPASTGSIGTPAAFSPFFVDSVDEKGGALTGAIQMDDKLILFKKTGIFVLQGDGPTNSGAQNDFSPAQLIATDTGCISGGSLVVTPVGVMYSSGKGIYLLDRSLTVQYIGAPVETYNYLQVLDATMIYDKNEIRFILSSSYILVYNYYFNQWSVFVIDATQAVIWKNAYTYCFGVQTSQESSVSFLDNGITHISIKIRTAWLSFAQIQGFQRIYKLLLLGEYKGPHRFSVNVFVDFNQASVQSVEIANYTQTLPSPVQYRVFTSRQKCQSMQFLITELPPVGFVSNEGLQFTGMAMEVGVKRGLNKITAAKSVG